jgi:Flp pilus assembly secretin CpaC
MIKRLLFASLLFLYAALGFAAGLKEFEQGYDIEIFLGHSVPFNLPEEPETIAIGDPSIFQTVTVKPKQILLNATNAGTTSMTVYGKSGAVYQHYVKVKLDPTRNAIEMELLAMQARKDAAGLAAKRNAEFETQQLRIKQRNEIAGDFIARLKPLVNALEKNVTVENLNGVVLLKGTVETAAAHARIISLVDRFLSTTNEPDFKVISDQGGILAGNLDEKTQFEPPQQTLSVPRLNVGGAGRGGGGQGGSGNALRQPLMDAKGNLGQNLNRAEVVMIADGKAMSLIKVAKTPKVEIQMQIVAVDRDKTDQMGIDWRLDIAGPAMGVVLGSALGGVAPITEGALDLFENGGTFNSGSSTLYGLGVKQDVGKYRVGLSTFLNFVQEKGAARTLSEPLITAISGESASFLVGGSIPIPVQTLSAGSSTQNAVVATNVNFIDFGLRLVVRPTVLENGRISIVLDQSITEPDNGTRIQLLGSFIPGFKQKSVSTVTESASGETWAVAGLLSEEDSKVLRKIPVLGDVPVFGFLFRNTDDRVNRNELMIIITARSIDGVNQTTTNFETKGRLAPSKSSKIQANNNELTDANYDDEILTKKSSDEIPISQDTKKNEPANQEKRKKGAFRPNQSFINPANRPAPAR